MVAQLANPRRCEVQRLNVHALPEVVTAEDLAGTTAVVIDVLRATTTIVYALAAGARAVVPCLTIEAAHERAAAMAAGTALLAGERGGLAIPGFDLGNSPTEFTPEQVGGKYVVLTTTNGTKALLHCRAAEQVLVAALANLSALCGVLTDCPRVELVCAGTDGHVTEEDLSWPVRLSSGWRPAAIGSSTTRLARLQRLASGRGRNDRRRTNGAHRDGHARKSRRAQSTEDRPGGRYRHGGANRPLRDRASIRDGVG